MADKHKAMLRRSLKFPPKRVFLTGGIGDVLALESFTEDSEWGTIRTFVNGTCLAGQVGYLVNSIPTFKPHYYLNLWVGCRPRNRCTQLTRNLTKQKFSGLEYWNIWGWLNCIRNGSRTYQGSGFLQRTHLEDLSRFNLPERYVCIFPRTNSGDSTNRRNFNTKDWEETFRLLKYTRLKGVLLGNPYEAMDDSLIINLSGQTSILETIAILKGSEGYVGIDSYLSVLAVKLPLDFIMVKTGIFNSERHRILYFMGATKSHSDCLKPEIKFGFFHPKLF